MRQLMTEPDSISELRSRKPQIIRVMLIVLVAVVVLAVGHYGFRAWRGRGDSGMPGLIQIGRAAGLGAANVPAPPRSAPAYAMPSPGGSGRSLSEYASRAAPEEVIRFYRAEMPRLGWAERQTPGGATAQEGLAVLWYSNAAGDSCIIAVSTRPAEETAVTVLRMPPSGGK
jgi:hypothetical protein